MEIKALVRSTRPPFLLLSPICVFLGIAAALHDRELNNPGLLWLVLAGALLSHVAVNMLNEYQDFTSGLDLLTNRTPFSGGSGALPESPGTARYVLLGVVLLLTLLLIIGLYISYRVGTRIVPIGLLGVLLVLTYTRWLNRNPWLCLVAPGTGFGLLMVSGTYVVLSGRYSVNTWLISLVPFFLANMLLLLNQYPDIEADRTAGRKHLAIAYGVRRANQAYLLFLLGAYSTILLLVLKGVLSTAGLLAILPMGLSLYAYAGARKYGAGIGACPACMAANVVAVLSTPLLLGMLLIPGA